MKITHWVLLFAIGLLAGCAAGDIGQDFDDTAVAKIQKNETSKAQIRQYFGEPFSVSTTSGMETWTYQYTNAYGVGYTQAATYGLVKEKPINKMLIIMFTGDRVTEYQYTR